LGCFEYNVQIRQILNVDSVGALSSVVEHYLHTVGVAGSSPAARTIQFRIATPTPRYPPSVFAAFVCAGIQI
jgi:hypothetical protein